METSQDSEDFANDAVEIGQAHSRHVNKCFFQRIDFSRGNKKLRSRRSAIFLRSGVAIIFQAPVRKDETKSD
jgi:hypothetical protein